ncbi:cytochrome P450 2J2-like [Engraulis encrasicolus]|uniref:cytochrome P450 2J2-like n=1 Tax=Engraulis encrasicolus TaxID=184585 RepID=UPI002FD19AB7
MHLSGLLMEYLDLKTSLVFLVIFLLLVDYLQNRKPSNYPPGPLPLPFFGNLFNIDAKQPHIYLTKLADVYGSVFSLRLGRTQTVFVNGYKLVKETLVGQADNFADRPFSSVADRIFPGNGGLFQSNGSKWRKHRRFMLTTLKNLGMGKSSLEDAIGQECNCLQREMETQKGQAFDPRALLTSAVSNIICQLAFGRRYDYADDTFQKMPVLMNDAIQLEGSVWGQMYEAFPSIMKHLPGRHNDIFSNYGRICDFIKEDLDRHKQNHDPSDPRDYMDTYLTEMNKGSGDSADGFDEVSLVLNCVDLFAAGTETTSTTLQWALIALMKYPHVQEKVQAEIDSVVGQSRQPSMADRASMPYTDAVIHEVQRMGNIVPLNGLHMAERDTTLGGYFIPKGTAVMPMLTSVLFDETEWETPHEFNPGHFLDAEGKFRRRDAFMPFSAGKRVCLGEQLARMELFLFFVALLQKFSFSTEEGVELSLEGCVGLTHTPHPFKIYAHLR